MTKFDIYQKVRNLEERYKLLLQYHKQDLERIKDLEEQIKILHRLR